MFAAYKRVPFDPQRDDRCDNQLSTCDGGGGLLLPELCAYPYPNVHYFSSSDRVALQRDSQKAKFAR